LNRRPRFAERIMVVPVFIPRLATLTAVTWLTACGCAAPFGPPGPPMWSPPRVEEVRASPPAARSRPGVVPAAHQEARPAELPHPHALAADPRPNPQPLAGVTKLTAGEVVRVVLERNPTLDQMRATAAAVAARYPQVTSLDDPTLAFSTAPGSAGSPNVNYAARVEVAQKLLYPGKRGLKGSAVQAEARAAAEDVEDARLQLVESARSALADYYLAVKATTVAEENAKLLGEFRKNAEARYKAGQGQQQDVLQADVEIARQDERLVSLRRARLVAVARLNTLMHLPPDRPLPPPADVGSPAPLPDAGKLREIALSRPDVQAVIARVASEEAALALALREYKPDVELMAAYDGFWQGTDRPLQWQVGLRTNLPVRYARRSGAVEEARAKVAQRRAELARLTDQIGFQVQEAFEQTREADDVVKLYETRILPAAAANVKEAQAGYTNNRAPFFNLIEAQRNAVGLRDRYYEALTESVRRRAALERAVGAPLSAPGR
jgi:outer membrane protein, heavy metal efflux system